MTTTVALNTEIGTWIGSDTQISCGGQRQPGQIKWLFCENNHALGFAGDKIAFDALQAHAKTVFSVGRTKRIELDEMIERIKMAFEEHGYEQHTDEDGVKAWGCDLLFATPRELYALDRNLSPVEIPQGTLWAVGSGCEYAMGAGNVPVVTDAQLRMQYAIEAGCAFDIHSSVSVNNPIFMRFLPR